ncbi:MAG: hypothetical protein NW241_15270 [Bacteroidia bacterium]|nr:hypothetical protein [Bacteroidia bacterium]
MEEGEHQGETSHLVSGGSEAADWLAVRESDTQAGYERYLRDYPDGRYRRQALERLELLESAMPASGEPEASEAEEAALDDAAAQDSPAAYAAFLARYPRSQYGEQVRNRIRQLEQRRRSSDLEAQAEQEAWMTASRLDTMMAYQDFLKRFPEGIFSATARERLEALERRFLQRLQQPGDSAGGGQAHLRFSRPLPPAPPQAPAPAAQDQAAGMLALIWLAGFMVLALLAWLLEAWLLPLALIVAGLSGGYLLYNRHTRMHARERWTYLPGLGLVAGLLAYIALTTLGAAAAAAAAGAACVALGTVLLLHRALKAA